MRFLRFRFFQSGRITLLRHYKIKGYKHIQIGTGFFANHFLRIEVFGNAPGGKLRIGDHVSLGENVHLAVNKQVVIGEHVLLGSRILITDHNHGCYEGEDQSDPAIPPNKRTLTGKRILVGENTWIGDGVVILPGVQIGKGCIIGANSVVTKDIPDGSMAAGIPCRVIKVYDPEQKKWIAHV